VFFSSLGVITYNPNVWALKNSGFSWFWGPKVYAYRFITSLTLRLEFVLVLFHVIPFPGPNFRHDT